MKKTGIIIIILLLLAGGAVGGWFYMTGAGTVEMAEVTGTTEDPAVIYTTDYQDDKYEQISLLKEQEHTMKNPLAVPNPYGTYTTGLYTYFTTWMDAQIVYTVEAEGYEDFTRTLYNGGENNYSKEHEYLLTGIVAGTTNTITLEAKNTWGWTIGSCTFEYDAPDMINEYGNTMQEVEEGENVEELTDGLYVMFGNNDISTEEGVPVYTAIVDDDGVVRGEMPVVDFRAHRFIFNEDGMYYSAGRKYMVCMEPTGYLSKILSMGEYALHHDYCFDKDGNLIILSTYNADGTKQDRILIMDKDSGEILNEIDLRDNFGDYLATLDVPAEPDPANPFDWIHINSLLLVGDDSLLLSSRETSTIIRLDDIYGEPTVAYMMGSDKFWEGTGYEDLLLEPEGDFSLHAGQHSLNYSVDDSLEDGQYYLSFYNNNDTISESRPDYDWDADPNYGDTGVDEDSRGASSYYYKYLVDENAGTYSLVQSIEVEYSGYVSSVQEYEGNIVMVSGSPFKTYEFDSEGNLIESMTYTGETWIYRTFKYDFKNYWYW